MQGCNAKYTGFIFKKPSQALCHIVLNYFSTIATSNNLSQFFPVTNKVLVSGL